MRQRLLTDPDWSQKATLLLQDVYQGIEPEVQRGRVRTFAASLEGPPALGLFRVSRGPGTRDSCAEPV